jgi:hypothetical protein
VLRVLHTRGQAHCLDAHGQRGVVFVKVYDGRFTQWGFNR